MPTQPFNKLFDKYARHRFAWLFGALLLTLGGHFVFGELAPGVAPIEPLLALTLIAAIAGAARERSIRLLIAFALAFVGSRAVAAEFGIHGLLSLSQALWVIAALLATVAAVRHALRARVVGAEQIFAALDAYLLVGLIFGVCYWLLDQVAPASFGVPSESDFTIDRAIYFSFVTISTLGYGDIVPSGGAARGFAILEAVSGQMYLAVLVAWLVSTFAREKRVTVSPPAMQAHVSRGADR